MFKTVVNILKTKKPPSMGGFLFSQERNIISSMACNQIFWPPTDASAIKPAFGKAKTATPSLYFAFTATPDLSATAEASAENSKSPSLNSAKSSAVSKKITSVIACPPACRPTLNFLGRPYLPFHHFHKLHRSPMHHQLWSLLFQR